MNIADSDQTSRSVASDLGLNCLSGPVYPNFQGYYGISVIPFTCTVNCKF